MEKNNEVDYIRKLKVSNILLKDNINYGRVIATKMYGKGFKYIFYLLIQLLFFNYKVLHVKNGKKILALYSFSSSNRKDYDEIVNNFKNTLEEYDELNLILKLSIKYCMRKIVLLVKTYLFYRRHNLKDCFKIAILVTFYSTIQKELENIIIGNKYCLLVTFSDGHHIENLAAQIANNNSIKTATLQHGQFRFLRKGYENGDCEAYENFISDYILTWGQATVDEFKKFNINENRMLKVGALKKFSNNSFHNKKTDANIFGVILSGETYKESNINLINLANQIAKQYDMKYVLRVHPKNNIRFYQSYCDPLYVIDTIRYIENKEYVDQVDFSLIHMTGVFVELLSLGTPLFVFEDVYLEDLFKIKGFTVSAIDEFKENYEIFLKNRSESIKFLQQQYYYFNERGNVNENLKQAIDLILQQ